MPVIAFRFVESRTRWRKGEPGTREGVVAVLDALRDGVGAEAVGLFDDDRAPSPLSDAALPINCWEAFGGLPCVDLAWDDFYRALKQTGQVETVCACGGEHQVRGFLLHERWLLLVVTPSVLGPGGATSLSSAIKALRDKLPPAQRHDRETAAMIALAGPPPAASGQVWWVRKTRH